MKYLYLLRRFTKALILGLSIILEFNHFYINNYFYHQIKGTAMATIFAVVGSNLTVAYFEENMFAILPQIYPKYFIDFFIRKLTKNINFLDINLKIINLQILLVTFTIKIATHRTRKTILHYH